MSAEEQQKVLEHLHNEYIEAFEARDANRIGQLYDDEGVIVEIGKRVIYGRNEITEMLKTLLAVGPVKLKVTVDRSCGAGEIVVQYGKYESHYPSEITAGNYMQILREHKGRYLILHEEFRETESKKP